MFYDVSMAYRIDLNMVLMAVAAKCGSCWNLSP